MLKAPPTTLCTLLNKTLLRKKSLAMSLQIGFRSKHQLGQRENAAIMVLQETMAKRVCEEIKALLGSPALTENPARTERAGKTAAMA